MSNNNDIIRYFAQGFRKKNLNNMSRYDQIQEGILQPVVNKASEFVISWFLNNIQRYGQKGFHMKMSGVYVDMFDKQRYQGFDFVYDLLSNHRTQFNWLMDIASKGVDMVEFNIQDQTSRLVMLLRQRFGWTIYPHEQACLYRTLDRIHKLIQIKRSEIKQKQGFF